METCKEHSGVNSCIKNLDTKLDAMTMKFDELDKKFDGLSTDFIRLNDKVDYLVKDRQEQRERYDKKVAWIRKIHYSIGAGVISLISYMFVNREAIRATLKEWLQR